MSNVIRRSDMRLRRSVNTSEFQEPTWKILTESEADTADLILQKYRKFDVGDNVVEMSAAEKQAVDAALALALETAILAELDAEPEQDVLNKDGIGPRVRALIQVNNRRIDYAINRIEELQQDLQAIKATSGPADTIRNAIRVSYLPTTTRTLRQAIDQYKLDLVGHKNPEP